jgi:D-alanyl-D-alanine carboxypeptidase/D-alanyl-D-alanine-endopeptidase (penicillin-binding protein 4)
VEAWGWDNIRWAMNRAGISHDGLLRVTHQAPVGAQTLATHYSVSLPVMLAKMLKKSDNLYADTFLKTVGRHYYNKPGSYRSGTMAVRAILTKHGIDLGNATLADGSGLSAHNLISARQMLSVLNFIQKNDAELDFIKLLPSSQVDGTLAWRRSVTAPMMKNKVHAKTGTITGTSNLAGFIDTAGGQRKAFVMFQRGLSQDPATHERYRASKAPGPGPSSKKACWRASTSSSPSRSPSSETDGLPCKAARFPGLGAKQDAGAVISSGRNRRWRTEASLFSALTDRAGLCCAQPHLNGLLQRLV